MYGNYNFWSWMRYWYLDSATYVTVMLLDKGYYDYDFEAIPEQEAVPEVKELSFDEGQAMWAKFGLGKFARKNEDLDSLQEHAMNVINQNKQ